MLALISVSVTPSPMALNRKVCGMNCSGSGTPSNKVCVGVVGWLGSSGSSTSLYTSVTSLALTVEPQQIVSLQPWTMPGAPGKLTPVTLRLPGT